MAANGSNGEPEEAGQAAPATIDSDTSGAAAARRNTTSTLSGSYVITLVGSVGMIVLTLFTGVLSARLLSPDGRGAVGAIAGWVMVITIISNFGFREGMGWIGARDRTRAPTVLTISIVAIFALSALGIGVAELFIPMGFAAQSDDVVRYAQIFVVWVLPYSACYAFTTLLGSHQRFGAVTAMRVGQPFVYAVLLAALWVTQRADVASVLIAQVVSFVVPAVLAFVALFRESGMAPFDWATTREGATYGSRAFGSTLGSLANSRLDIMILPALVVSSEIGLYVVAVSASTMIVGIFGSLQVVVFPAAARTGGAAAVALAQRAIRVVLAASMVSAVVLGLFAGLLVEFLYGSEFDGSVTPFRLLLPGASCWAVAQITTGGLKGIGRPTAASVAQFAGVAVTIVGLLVLLGPFGIQGAAIASSLSYSTVLIVGLILFARATDTTIRDTLSARALLADVRWTGDRISQILRRDTQGRSPHASGEK